MRRWMVTIWLILVFFGIGLLFYYNEWVYLQPTPVPLNYQFVKPGTLIPLAALTTDGLAQPVFLHFFNPDCPCSRFNIAQFKLLVAQYSNHVHFVIVVISKNNYTTGTIQDKFNLKVSVLFDPTIAAACGVYSTPQAVLLDAQHHLYYRGNYNTSRYCTDEKTNYAKIALNGVLNSRRRVVFNPLALRAYGCSLPGCNR